MKHKVKIAVGSLALFLGGTSSTAVVAHAINNQNIVETTSDNTININENNNGVKLLNYKATADKTDVKNEATAGSFDFVGMIAEGIQSGGTGLITSAISQIGTLAFNQIMTSLGFDMRSETDKKLDKIEAQLNNIQNDLKEGISDIKRRITQLHNEDIMNRLLDKFYAIQTPIASKMATLLDIAKKELDPKYDKNTLANEKETFYKGLESMRFDKLDGNNLWNEAENLAKSIITPYAANTSIKLNDLYEETYGTIETWDYMTVAPRRQFIGYIGSLVNSLAQLAKIKASYEMSKLKEGDSNLLDYQTGINSMVSAVNTLNGEFKTELDKLSAIEKKHDEQHLITRREQVVDKDGNISYKDGKTVSTKLLAVTADDNDHNYISYTHDEKNILVRYDTGAGASFAIYADFIYTLDCTQNQDLYKTVIADYVNYKAIAGNKVNNFTMQDYLTKVGFTCDDKDLFTKAKGFYNRIDDSKRDGADDGFWKTDKNHDLKVHYYDFETADGKEAAATYSVSNEHKDGWFSKTTYSGNRPKEISNYYLCFINPDQKTIDGKIVRTTIEGNLFQDDYHGHFYNDHFKGHKKWTGSDKDPVVIG